MAALFGIAAPLALVGCSGSDDNKDEPDPSGDAGQGGTSVPGASGSLNIGGSGSAGGAGGTDGTCGGSEVAAETKPVQMLLLLDRSDSMLKSWGESDRWTVTKDAVNAALSSVQDKMSIGLQLFPSDDHCAVPTGSELGVGVGDGMTTVPVIETTLEATSPAGATPTADALRLALSYFTTGAGRTLAGDKYVLLATDGGPNCNTELSCEATSCTTNMDGDCSIPGVSNCCDGGAADACLDDARTVAQVRALRDAGIKTFVVGIPGSDIYGGVLDQLAVQGGTAVAETSPRYFEVVNAAELKDTLTRITKTLITTCEFELQAEPPLRSFVNVFIDGTVLPQAGDNGWSYKDTSSPPTIVIKGTTCASLQDTGAESVRIEFGCPTVE